MKRVLSKSFIILGSLSMAAMALTYFIYTKNSFLDSKSLSSVLWYTMMFKTHIAFGIISILTGAFQFIKSFRKRWLSAHKTIGKVYLLAIFISSICGFIVAQFATGGLISRLGFSILAVLWFYFTFQGFKYAKAGDIPAHKVWIYRSFALTFSSFTLRIFLLGALFNIAPFIQVYQFASWGCWITNLIVCELIIYDMKNKKNLIEVETTH